jgi:outer membrane protein assembly factor BamA
MIVIVVLASCNSTKYVPKGDALYTGASVKVNDSTLSKKEKKRLVTLTSALSRPLPNSKFLGISFKLFFYNLAGNPAKKNFFRKLFRKIGQPPVLLSSVDVEYNSKLLQNYLENIGYFQAESNGDTVVKRGKAHANYTLMPGRVYTIKTVEFKTDSTALGRAIKETKSKSFLHLNDPFNLEMIKGERSRIDAALKEEGYYYFNPDLLILDADSTIGNHKVNMLLRIKENTPTIAKKPYIIDSVFIYPNFRINAKEVEPIDVKKYFYDGYYIIDPGKKFKPRLFPRIMLFDSADVYSRIDHNLTLSRLINLDVFKFVKNKFVISSNNKSDTGRLNTYYYLTPLPIKSLRGEVSGNTKSNNYIGSLFTLTFRNRNTFSAAEHLDIYGDVGSEMQYSGLQSGYNTYKFGGGITFTIPKFVIPFFDFSTTNAFVPKSKISLSYDLLNRVKLYTLNSMKAELGYVWKPSPTIQQEFNPISINYVRAVNITQKYRDSLAQDPILKHAIENQFVIGSNYSYTIDPFVNNQKGTGFYFNGIVDLSGNIVGLLVKKDPITEQKNIFGTPFSQYLKTQSDLRYYYAINSKTRLANRIILGFGYPYGNSNQLPYIKQFFIGGTNSLRAFPSRSVGPGTYRDPMAGNLSFFPDESGDIKLEMNTELRYTINNILEGALFIDMGNIWLYNKDTLRSGAQFSKNFLNELAIGTGVGLRLNFTILLLRIDLGMPLREPWLPSGQRWVINQIDFGNKQWRRNNLVLNLGIGYPF